MGGLMKKLIILITMVFFVTMFVYALEIPLNVEITHTETHVNISWSYVYNASHYKVYT